MKIIIVQRRNRLLIGFNPETAFPAKRQSKVSHLLSNLYIPKYIRETENSDLKVIALSYLTTKVSISN